MSQLFSKDETLSLSPPIMGWSIIKVMRDQAVERISIYDLAEALKRRGMFSAKAMYLGLLFLFLIGEIEVRQAYVERTRHADNKALQ